MTKIKSPQLYQLSYRPERRFLHAPATTVPAVYPGTHRCATPFGDSAEDRKLDPLSALRRVTVGGAS